MKLRKQSEQSDTASDWPYPNNGPGRPWYGLFRGDSGTDAYRRPLLNLAGPESSMLVIGPPRSGKTSSIIIPCVLDAPAAVVSTSTKSDVLAVTLHRRWALGRCFVFDPSGTTEVPSGAFPLRWSPVVGSRTFERAVEMAHALATASRPGSALSESAHWVERAEALLGPLLYAAALGGADMAAVTKWILGRDIREPQAVLSNSGHQMAHAVLAGVLASEERERSGIFSTASGLLAAYRSEAALATTRQPNFDPEEFVRSNDALYICAPSAAQDQLAPVVVALLEQITKAAYGRPINAAPIVFALDEVAAIAPLPSLPALAAEGGGQGVITLACLQDLSQARSRWGDVAEGFFSIFNTKLIFSGIGDHQTLSLISALAGDEQVPMMSYTRGAVPPLVQAITGHRTPCTVTTGFVWRPRLPIDVIAEGRRGAVLCLDGTTYQWLGVQPWWAHPVWSQVARQSTPRWREIVRPGSPRALDA